MTTTNQRAIFNPGVTTSNATRKSQDKEKESKEYPTTTDSTRNQIRKLIYEAFQGDTMPDETKYSVSDIVEIIENAIADEHADPKSKQYRDKSRIVTAKLKGPRFEESRKALRHGELEAKTFILDDNASASGNRQAPLVQANQNQRPGGGGPPGMQPPGFRPAGPIGGSQVRPRPGAPGAMFRPPIGGLARPPIQQQMQTQQQQRSPNQNLQQEQLQDKQTNQQQEQTPPSSLKKSQESNPKSRETTDDNRRKQSVEYSGQGAAISSQDRSLRKNQADMIQSDGLNHITNLNFHQQQSETILSNRSIESKDNNRNNPISFNNQMSESDQLRIKPQSTQNLPQYNTQSHQLASVDFKDEYQHNIDQHQQQQQFQDSANFDSSVDPSQISIGDDSSVQKLAKGKGKKKKKKGKKSTANIEYEFSADKSSSKQVNNYLQNEYQPQTDEKISPQTQPIPEVEEEFNYPAPNQNQQSAVLTTEPYNPFVTESNAQQKQPKDISLEDIEPSEPIAIVTEEKNQPNEQQEDEKLNMSDKENNDLLKKQLKKQIFEYQDDQQSMSDNHNNQEENKNNNSIDPNIPPISYEKSQSQPILDAQIQNKNENQEIAQLSQRQHSLPPQNELQVDSTIQENRLQNVHQKLADLRQNSELFMGGRHANSIQSMTSFQIADSEAVKRLQDQVKYLKDQNKELKERLLLVENDCHLQQRKANIVMDENKQIREESRKLQKEVLIKQQNEEKQTNENKLTISKLEIQVKEKLQENEQIKRDIQRSKEEKEGYKEKYNQLQNEITQQRQQMEKIVKTFQNRSIGGAVSSSLNVQSSQFHDNAASNQQEQIESVQKEMNEMKSHYEAQIRENNNELQMRMKDLQRSERQNLQLQQKNRHLQDNLSQFQVQTLSTVAGSGSNQRDSQQLLGQARRGGRSTVNEEEEEGGSSNNRMLFNREDEGTGGGSYSQPRHDYYGEEGGNMPMEEEDDQYDENNNNNNNILAGVRGIGDHMNQADVVGGPNEEDMEYIDDEDDAEDDYEEDYLEGEGGTNIGGAEELGNEREAVNQQLSINYQEGSIDDAGGQQTSNNVRQGEERKQSHRRGNKQRNQQHNISTTGGGSNTQNASRVRGQRGRQVRNNQQHVLQQQQQTNEIGQANTTSSAINVSHHGTQNPSMINRNQQQNQEYFQSYGDSSSNFANNASSSHGIGTNQQHQQHSSGIKDQATGSGVVHTANRQNQQNSIQESLMSAESGSTALLDRNSYYRPPLPTRQGHQSVSQQQLAHQTGSNNNQYPTISSHFQQPGGGIGGSHQQHMNESSAGEQDIFGSGAAAVNVTVSGGAAWPRNNTQQYGSSNVNNNNNNNVSHGNNQFYNQQYANNEELKQSSDLATTSQSSYPSQQQQHSHSNSQQQTSTPYSSNNQQQNYQNSYNFGTGAGGSNSRSNNPNNVGGSGEQDEDESTIGGQYTGQRSHINQRRTAEERPYAAEQSTTPRAVNDSKRTSGANTPTMEGADTPPTKSYRSQQQQNSYVHNLTSNQLFMVSNQDESEGGQAPSYNHHQQNQQRNLPHHQQHHQHNSQQELGVGVIPHGMFE